MKLIVGLGNPGKKYARTRHNAGFRALDLLALRVGVEFRREKFQGLYAEGRLPGAWEGPEAGDGRLLLLKPQAFMNLSGQATASLAGFFKLDPADLLVVADDVALAVGALRMRRSGSAGGHNGLQDIEACLGTQAYARLRVGVGGREANAARPVADLVSHVTGNLEAGEEKIFAESLERAAEACLSWAGRGIEEAMNRFNTKAPPPKPDL